MKTNPLWILLLAILVVAVAPSVSADQAASPAQDTTHLRAALSQRGQMFTEESHLLGALSRDRIRIEAVVVTSASGPATKGFRVSVDDQDARPPETITESAVLDPDEAAALSSAITAMVAASHSWAGRPDFEQSSFISHDGLKVFVAQPADASRKGDKGQELVYTVTFASNNANSIDLPTESEMLRLKSMLDDGAQWLSQH